MIFRFLSLVFLLVMIGSCNTSKVPQQPEDLFFKVVVVQDGKEIKPDRDNRVQLNKAPFQLKLTYYKTDNVYVSASWGTFFYDLPATENIFKCEESSARGINEKCYFVAIKTGAEERFNDNKDIYVGDRSYHVNWFYDQEMDWYRMDRGVKVEDGVIYATVTVENIFDLDERDRQQRAASAENQSAYEYAVEQVEEDIHMVFATGRYEQGMEYPEELQRQKFILSFN